MSKPREFWLDIATPYGDPCDFISEGKPHDHPAATNIHVIEKTAFDELDDILHSVMTAFKQTSDLTPTQQHQFLEPLERRLSALELDVHSPDQNETV